MGSYPPGLRRSIPAKQMAASRKGVRARLHTGGALLSTARGRFTPPLVARPHAPGQAVLQDWAQDRDGKRWHGTQSAP
jgi:hypothetical protein